MATTPVQDIPVFDSLVTSCREIAQDPEFTVAKRWLKEHPGKKAVGCFPVSARWN